MGEITEGLGPLLEMYGAAGGAFANALAGEGTAALEAEEAATSATRTFYRGDVAGLTDFESYAAQSGGQANSEAVLANGDPNELMEQHAIDSANPPSPYISVTTNPDVARIFAGSNGSVYQLQLAPGRAVLNPFNNATINGIPEDGYLVPHYISPNEINGTIP